MNTPPKKPGSPTPPAPAKGADDGSIPVLTERLGLPPLEFDTTLPLIESTGQNMRRVFEGLTSLPNPPRTAAPPVTPAAAAPVTAPPVAVPPPQAPAPSLAPEPMITREPIAVHGATAGNAVLGPRMAAEGPHWARIEIELRQSILRQIAEQLPREVEAIVRNRMSATIDRLLSSLAAETRLAIAASLREIVERAVHAELERLRNSNRG